MTVLDRVEEGLRVGIPLDILRAAHPRVVIRDEETSFKLLQKGLLNFVESTRIVDKEKLRLARTVTLGHVVSVKGVQ